MKLNKKKVLVAALALSVVAILSLGTLAWYTDTDTVTNKFMTATSGDTDPEDIFSIDVWEKVDIDGNGDIEEKGKDEGDLVVTYEDQLVPGDVLVKEPIVTNTGDHAQWVRVNFTISDAAAWQAAVPAGSDLAEIFVPCADFDTLWTLGAVTEDTTADTLTYTYYLNGTLAPGAEVPTFTHVQIPTYLTKENVFALGADGFSLTVEAEAVQAEHTGDNAVEAFALVEQTQAADFQ